MCKAVVHRAEEEQRCGPDGETRSWSRSCFRIVTSYTTASRSSNQQAAPAGLSRDAFAVNKQPKILKSSKEYPEMTSKNGAYYALFLRFVSKT